MDRRSTPHWEPLVPTANLLAGLLAAAGVVALIQAIQVTTAMSGVKDVTVPIGQLGLQLQTEISPAPIGGIVSLLTLGTGVVWLIWQHKAQRDLHARELPGLKFTPGWAVGWWFIPLANLVMPYRCVRELRDRAGRAPAAPTARVRGDWKLLGWWLTYVASSYLVLLGFGPVIGAIIRSISDQAATSGSASITSITLSAASIHMAQLWTIAGDVVRAAAAGLAVWLVLTISRNEDASGGELMAPAAELPWPPPLIPRRPDLT